MLPATFPGSHAKDRLTIDMEALKHMKVVCEAETSGTILRDYNFPITEYAWREFMDAHITGDARMVIEASTSGKYLTRLLKDHGFEVHMVNPTKMRAIYELYRKTDRYDARILAEI